MKNRIYISFLISILSVVSCIENKDGEISENIDYVNIVSGISKDSYTLYLGDTLRISPEVSFNDENTKNDYTYKWVIGYNQVISESKDLEWEISLPKDHKLNKEISGSFIVTNSKNGLEYRQVFTVIINTGYAPTYLLIYETPEGSIDWTSIQGSSPREFTRFFNGMSQRVNTKTISGKFRGAIGATSEVAIFTDHAPDYGYTLSLVDATDESVDFVANLGEIIAPITERVYRGNAINLDFHHINYGEGGSKTIIQNDKLYVFNGMEKKLPIFDDVTYFKDNKVAQAEMSKQFIRSKKVNIIRYTDGRIKAFHAYNDPALDELTMEGEPFKLDYIHGIFSESTGMGSNKPYNIHIVGEKDGNYGLYIFNVPYIGTKVQPITFNKVVPLPYEAVKSSKYWFGSYGQKYGFYTTMHDIYKYDYLDISSFPVITSPFISFPPSYEIVNIFPQLGGTGFSDRDDCTVVLLYDNTIKKTSIYVYETVSGDKIIEYKDIIPGKGLDFFKKK